MNAKIFVTGGTGGLGSHTVPLLRAAGCNLRILSRSAREDTECVENVTGDLLTGDGLDGALVASGSWTDFLAAHVG